MVDGPKTSMYLPSIDQELAEKPPNRTYRASFFIAETSTQLIAPCKQRKLTQAELASRAESGQPATSPAEAGSVTRRAFLRRMARNYASHLPELH